MSTLEHGSANNLPPSHSETVGSKKIRDNNDLSSDNSLSKTPVGPKPIRVPQSVADSDRPEIISFVLKTERMEPLRKFLFLVFTHTRPQYHEDFHTQCKKLLVREIDPSQYLAFVEKACTFSKVDDKLGARLSSWIDDIHKTTDKIEKLAQNKKRDG